MDCKEHLLRQAWTRFAAGGFPELASELDRFCEGERRAVWLDDWALYISLKREHSGSSWLDWAPALRRRDPRALRRKSADLADEIRFATFCQFLFFRQWSAVRRAAEGRGIRILGDVPIYVAPDSADTWANSALFDLATDGSLRAVAGVPPDYFSADGQRWGNPLYRWDVLQAQGYSWWIARLRAQLEIAHVLRLDHFRGFVAYWRIPERNSTARRGKWVKGPGEAFFHAVRSALGGLPLLAEDLGEIDARVHSLRKKLDLAGMRVLQFGFGASDSDHSPHRHPPRSVVYTGTHDNDTTRGWFATAGEDERQRVLTYLGATSDSITAAMIRAAYGSVAELAVLPLQDVLNLGSDARMNTPGKEGGNWRWRVRHEDVPDGAARRMHDLAEATARLPGVPWEPRGAESGRERTWAGSTPGPDEDALSHSVESDSCPAHPALQARLAIATIALIATSRAPRAIQARSGSRGGRACRCSTPQPGISSGARSAISASRSPIAATSAASTACRAPSTARSIRSWRAPSC